MKKFFSVAILAAVLIFVGGQEKVFAYDIYCGTRNDNREVYLMTESIQFSETQLYDYINCTVKAVRGGSVTYIKYFFELNNGGTIFFRNSQGASGNFGGVYSRNGDPYPIASNVFGAAYKYVRG